MSTGNTASRDPPSTRPRRSLRQRYWLRRAEAKRRSGDAVRAFTYATHAAVAGDRDAQAVVALGYLHGHGVPANLGEASRWFERAAAKGHLESMVFLAKLALQGLAPSAGGKPDYVAGRRWAEQAAAAGVVEAKLLLGNILLWGPPEWQDLGAARSLFQDAAAQGHAAGCLGLVFVLLQGAPDRAARAQIASLIQTAAGQNLPMAVYFAGVMSEFGLGVPLDAAAAVRHYQFAAEAAVRPAQTRLGFALLHGIGTDRDAEAGETWLRKAGLAGDATAAYQVGEIYALGGDLPPNHAEAAIWLTRAAELGHQGAAAALASMQPTALAAYRDRRNAAMWAPRASDTGPVEPTGDPAVLLAILSEAECRWARAA